MGATANILIVDDDPLQREIAVEMLSVRGYACRTAEDGDVALARLAEAPADLVVLDMIMPNREGIETFGEIRRRWPATQVVMITGGTRSIPPSAILGTAAALGADATAAKPLRADDFTALVAGLLAERAPTR